MTLVTFDPHSESQNTSINSSMHIKLAKDKSIQSSVKAKSDHATPPQKGRKRILNSELSKAPKINRRRNFDPEVLGTELLPRLIWEESDEEEVKERTQKETKEGHIVTKELQKATEIIESRRGTF